MHTVLASPRAWALSLGASLALATGAASAAHIVDPGSTYFFRIFGEGFGGIALNGMVFDGAASVHIIDGRTLTMSENQTDNGNGTWTIKLALSSDVDMAPGSSIFSRFGHGDPLDLLHPVRLIGANLAWAGFNADGSVFSFNSEVLGFLEPANRDPWGGFFANPPTEGIGYFDVPTLDFRSVEWTMTVQRVPEPPPLALVAIALAGLAAAQRRKRA